MTLYLDTDPKERAAESKELARLAVMAFNEKREELSRAVPTVLRDHEDIEQERSVNGAA